MRLGRLAANSSSLTSPAACLGSWGHLGAPLKCDQGAIVFHPPPVQGLLHKTSYSPVEAASYQSSSPLHCYLVPLQLLQLSCGDWPWRRWPDRIDLISCLSFLNSDIFLFLSFCSSRLLLAPRFAPRTLRQRLAQVDFDRSVVAWRAVSGLRTRNGLCSRQTDLP